MGKKYTKDTIAVCIPAAGPVEPLVLANYLSAVNYAAANGVKINHFEFTDRVLLQAARQLLAEKFLKSDAEWVLWLDTDMQLPRETIVELLRSAKKLRAKFMGTVYYQRLGDHCPLTFVSRIRNMNGTVLQKTKSKYEFISVYIPPGIKDAVEIDSSGFGCILVHREVFEKIKPPYFKFLSAGDPDVPPDMNMVCEDTYFFAKAKEAGYKIYVLPYLDVGHISSPAVIRRRDSLAKRMEKLKNDPSPLDLRVLSSGGVSLPKRSLKR